MRVFAAVFPPPEVQKTLLRAAQSVVTGSDVRWVRPENAHLTLKFLGDVEEKALDGIRAALAEVAQRHGPFPVRLSGLGAFPSRKKGRVLWAGVNEGSAELTSLAGDVQCSLESLGFEGEGREYKPHATLGRARGRPVRLPDNTGISSPRFIARELHLVESVLGAKGATYEKLERYPFPENLRNDSVR